MLKKRKGFTLFEAIISVGIIAVSSITILQIFYTSGNLNRRASDLDTGNSILTQAIELSQTAEDPTVFFNNGDIFNGRVSVASENPKALFTVANYYDKEWNVLIPTGEEVPNDTKFVATYDLIEEEVIFDEQVIDSFAIGEDSSEAEFQENKGVLYTIDATINIVNEALFTDNVGDLSSPVLTTLSSGKFIGNTRN